MTESAPGASRRALVRGAAHAAWAVPAVSLATAAPAHAATSNGGAGLTYTAQWWVFPLSKKYVVIPALQITNPGSVRTIDVPVVTMNFPVNDFWGIVPMQVGPPWPAYANISGFYPWIISTISPAPGDSVIKVRATWDISLAAGQTVTLGSVGWMTSPPGIVWANNPTVPGISFTIDMAKSPTITGVMQRVGQPPH
ncbi:MAG: hypothetical protein QM747_11905 [Nocardioides sp.]